MNLKLQKGKIYGLLGLNCPEKAARIKILSGLLAPTDVGAFVPGNKIPDKKIASYISYMGQETVLYIGLTVHQNIEFYAKLFGINKAEIKVKEKDLLEFVDLYD